MVVISCFTEIIKSFKFKFLWFPFSFPSQSISLACTQRNAPFLWGALSIHLTFSDLHSAITFMDCNVNGWKKYTCLLLFPSPSTSSAAVLQPRQLCQDDCFATGASHKLVSFLHWYSAEPMIESRLFHCVENKFFSSATTSISLALLWLWTSGCTG